MRRVTGVFAMLIILSLATVSAQESVLYYETSVEPATYTVKSGEFQKDENGELKQDETGAYIPVEQFVTLTVSATMQCSVPPDGEKIYFFASGGGTIKRTDTESGDERIILKLEPNEVALNWTQDEALGAWTVNEEIDIQIINQAKPAQTLNQTFRWGSDRVDIPEACPQDAQDFDITPHEVIVPGFDQEDAGDETSDDETQGTPSVGPLGVVLAIGLLSMALPRRFE